MVSLCVVGGSYCTSYQAINTWIYRTKPSVVSGLLFKIMKPYFPDVTRIRISFEIAISTCVLISLLKTPAFV